MILRFNVRESSWQWLWWFFEHLKDPIFIEAVLVSSHMYDVIFVVGTLDIGGAERHLSYLLPELSRRGLKVLLFVMNKDGPLRSVFESGGVPVVIGRRSLKWVDGLKAWILKYFPPKTKTPSFLILNVIQFSWNFWTFCRLLMRNRRAILHCFLPGAVIYGGAAALAVMHPKRFSSRRSMNLYQSKRPVFGWLDRFFTRTSQYILGNSQAVVNDLLGEGQPSAKVGLIYNGIPIPEPLPPAVRSDGWVMSLVANLIPYKGHTDLLHALARIQDRLPRGWELRCAGVGSPEYTQRLQELGQELGIASHIRWLGSVRDVNQLYSGSHIGLLVSHEEGFSNSLLEAMACALPLVVTRVGGNAEAVVDGETGWVVPPRDSERLAEALLAASQVDRNQLMQMGERAQRRMLNQFSLAACGQSYLDLYKKWGAPFDHA